MAFYRQGIVLIHMTVVLALDDWRSYSLIQSELHWGWVLAYGNKLETRPQYTPTDCFETFSFPDSLDDLDTIGECYYQHRQSIMQSRQEGLTKTYNRFHNPDDTSSDIVELRRLHIEMDQAVAAAYGWEELDLGHDFHDTKQGIRFTISETARREVLDRLLELNHQRYAEEVAAGLHDKKAGKAKSPITRKRKETAAPSGATPQLDIFGSSQPDLFDAPPVLRES
ncbi:MULTISPECIES: type IIL restriction-modification enzyme MmeI [unclassified Thiocapsa]|uniref:type IIL restriction-modification enzyme MmeI n=1 Tax=unclassified Thiocapsa TaxID=2641286 RepID=UPI0035B145C5